DDLLDGHTEPRHRHVAERRGQPELAVVGVPHHRNADGVLLRQAVAAGPRAGPHQFFPAALFWRRRCPPPGFRAIYLGVLFNIMIMATVTFAAIKIAGVLLGLDPYVTVVLAALITMVYATTAGLWGGVMTDFFQFALAMIGSFAAAYYALSQP